MSSTLAGLQMALGDKVGYLQSDAIANGGVLDTTNADYDVVRAPGPDGKVLFVQDKIGIVEGLTQGAVKTVAALDESVTSTASIIAGVLGLSSTAAGAALGQSPGNQALSKLSNAAGYYLLETLLKGGNTDFGLRRRFASFVGAQEVPVDPQAKFQEHVKWDDFGVVLRNGGTFQSDGTARTLIAFENAVVKASDQGDILVGFKQSTFQGGSGNDLLLGKDKAVLRGGAGRDVLVGGNDAKLYGEDGNDILFAFGNAVADGGSGDDALLGYGDATVTGDTALTIRPEDWDAVLRANLWGT